MILGIDEVGRGAWAGPLVVGAVVLGEAEIDGLTDSKALTKKRRKELASQIHENAAGVGLGWVSAQEIDEHGLSWALCEGTKRAVSEIRAPYHEIIIDGTINFLAGTTKGEYVTTLPKADLLIASVSAASIVAKVARDEYMAEQDEQYPGYGWAGHVGYGTAKHRGAIADKGVTPLHRLSFAPLAKYKNDDTLNTTIDTPSKITTKQIGDTAEAKVCEYLKANGHEILAQNWRTKWCEIDIVSTYDETLYFTEVKYRNRSDAGDGFAAITPSKLKQMRFAAELFMQKHHASLRDVDVCLQAASVTSNLVDVVRID